MVTDHQFRPLSYRASKEKKLTFSPPRIMMSFTEPISAFGSSRFHEGECKSLRSLIYIKPSSSTTAISPVSSQPSRSIADFVASAFLPSAPPLECWARGLTLSKAKERLTGITIVAFHDLRSSDQQESHLTCIQPFSSFGMDDLDIANWDSQTTASPSARLSYI